MTRTVVLACSPDTAFRLFTERIDAWWPPERRHTTDPNARLVLEASGRFAECTADGVEVPLGRVRDWQPPDRLVLDFYPGTGPDRPTEVEVRFVAEGQGTRVVVEHRPTPASEALFPTRVARYEASWALCLSALERADRGDPTP